MDHIRTILLPTDFSDCSRFAFRLAETLAHAASARLVVLHVNQTLGPLVAFDSVLRQLQPKEQENRLWHLLRHFRARDAGVPLAHRLESGDAAEEILRVARESGCDLIVMGTHGWTGLNRLLLGSVAERVLRKSPCPVVVVKLRIEAAAEFVPPRAQTVQATAP